MTPVPSSLADVLAACHAHGIRLSLAAADGLTIDAPPDALTPELLGRLKAHKAELLTDLNERFEERAAIIEFDAGLSRKEAEQLARNN